MILRVLVGAAAVAIIGYVGFFAYERIAGHYQAGRSFAPVECDAYRAEAENRRSGAPRKMLESDELLRFKINQCAENDM